jgi:hypothetical protein
VPPEGDGAGSGGGRCPLRAAAQRGPRRSHCSPPVAHHPPTSREACKKSSHLDTLTHLGSIHSVDLLYHLVTIFFGAAAEHLVTICSVEFMDCCSTVSSGFINLAVRLDWNEIRDSVRIHTHIYWY